MHLIEKKINSALIEQKKKKKWANSSVWLFDRCISALTKMASEFSWREMMWGRN